jgi:hypothetical protein
LSARAAAWLAWALPFAVYASCISSAPAYWDTGEAQTVPWIFGIMHATGFPTFTVLAGIFAHAVPFGTVAWRIGLFCALAMSGGAWLVWRCAVALEADVWSATAAAWLFAFGHIAWTRGTRAEVHALALFFAMATIYAALIFLRTGSPRAFAVAALSWGLGLATHPIVLLLLPALVLVVLERLRVLNARVVFGGCIALLLGLSLYAYLPVRSAMVTQARLDPTRSIGLPPGKAFWDNNHPSSLPGFLKEVGGAEYGPGGAFARMAQWRTYRAALPVYLDGVLAEITPLGILLALAGIVILWRRNDPAAMFLTAAFAFPTAFAMAYTIEAEPLRYYLTGYAVLAALTGYGLSRFVRALPAARAVPVAVAMATAAGFLIAGADTFQQRRSSGAEEVISSVVKNTPRDAILIVPWLDATPLAYAAYVEHRLDDRIVETAWLSEDARRVPAWIRVRPVFVVGQVFGEVPGYLTVRTGKDPIFRIVPSPHSARSR